MILLEKVILLKQLSFFKEVSDDLLIEIASRTEEDRVKQESHIIEKGKMGDTLYIIVEGKVAVEDENKRIAILGKNEIFGELAVLSPEVRTASIIALEDCLLLKLHRYDLIEHLSIDINLALGIIQELCQRIRTMVKQIHELKQHESTS